MLKKLRDIWDDKSEIAAAWALLADDIALAEELDPIESIGDALEQITVADLLESFPGGFAVGPMGGLYGIVRAGNFNNREGTGHLIVRKVIE